MLPATAPGFDQPLELLRACHERILKHCDILQRLAAHLAENGPDQAAREAARQVLHYFSTAGQHHHQDEEQDLFPALLRSAPQSGQLIARLKTDHAGMEAAWRHLEPLLADPGRITDIAGFAAQAAAFQALYAPHIRTENTELLPLAAQVLGAPDQSELGRRMAARRGVRLQGTPSPGVK